MKEPIYTLRLNRFEYGVIFNSLNDKRNELIAGKQDTEIVDNALLKVIEAKERCKGRDRSEGR
ncbi:hypothetical protein Aargi30884_17180 [Amedibacterium intestinale]|uniref:Uncharacterized protein n=1 Tax=Amedibacterium intestinale TaxID=2583452 RepID=A0A6N4TK80_9FIRM|nr:hypothetical protein [Amedibacterium intestinale]BBK22815.1 hypothetical protein Aargi30884_17180 [Amedibacterium intestinale]